MKEILENMKEIRNLKKINTELNEQIKNEGIELANKLLYSLYTRLSIYIPIIKELKTGINIALKSYKIDSITTKTVHIVSNYSNNTWQIMFDNYNVDLKIGIRTLPYYQKFCINNPILIELDFDQICQEIEKRILNTQKNIISNIINDNHKTTESLKSFKEFVNDNIMITLNKLFKLKNDFKDSGNLDLIESIITAIDTVEDYIAEDFD